MGMFLPAHRARNHRRRVLGGGYNEKVLRIGPIAYWPQDEISGNTARCLVNPAQNGTYAGVTLANDVTGPFGTPAPYYDGANDSCNIETAALLAALNGSEGTIAAWVRVATGAWTDATSRAAVYLTDIPAYENTMELVKRDTNNLFRWRYSAGAVVETVDNNAMGGYTSWFFVVHTWSKSADQFKAYLNGVQTGVTQTTLGVWAGGITDAVIGAATVSGPSAPWHGWIGPVFVLAWALPPAGVADLYVT